MSFIRCAVPLGVLLVLALEGPVLADVAINEIRIDQPSTDTDEYFELTGTPGQSLNDLTYLVIGDGSSAAASGVIENVTSLTGLSVAPSGFFVAAESTFTLGTADLTTDLGFENSDNVTHLVVRGFSGSNGDDLDTDDDGVLDVEPWSEVVDSVALVESTTGGEHVYSDTRVGPDGSYVPAHVYRCPDRSGAFEIGPFSSFDNDTPGAANCVALAINEIRIDQPSTDNDEYFELSGSAGQALDGLTYVVIGDGAGASGVIEHVTALTGQSIPGDGFFVAAESTFTLASADLVTTLNFENSDNVTHLLVRDFTGANGDDLDVDDDGVLDVEPWSDVVDSVALIETTGSGEHVYSDTRVGPDGSYVPGHVYRCPDTSGPYQIGSFTAGSDDSAGAANTCGGSGPLPISARIAQIQGAGHISPLAGQEVTTSGIVIAVDGNGFYLQDALGDGDLATSDGILVYTGSAPTAIVGDEVEVTGTIQEYRPRSNGLTITEFGSAGLSVTVLSSGNPLPAPAVIGQGGRVPPTEVIDDDSPTTINIESDAAASFDPTSDGVDFYESLEGMRVAVNDVLVVGNRVFGSGGPGNVEIYGVADNGSGASLLTPRGGIVIRPGDFNPERIVLNNALQVLPEDVDVGDRFPGAIVGVIDYNYGKFLFMPTEPIPVATDGGLRKETTLLAGDSQHLTVATLNVENLDPGDGTRFDDLAVIIADHMNGPDIIGVQEVQDDNGPTNDGTTAADRCFLLLIEAIARHSGIVYDYRQIDPLDLQDGGQPGGNIRVGFLFRPDRVAFIDRGTPSATDATRVLPGPVLSISPGRVDPSQFVDSRKPIAGEFEFQGKKVFVIVSHNNSKSGDDPLFGFNQPPVLGSEAERMVQMTAIKQLVVDILAEDAAAHVAVVGDLNDFQFSAPVDVLRSAGLSDLIDLLPPQEQYTYNYEGNAQVLDHILVSDALMAAGPEVDIVRVNSEFGVQASDHDPVVSRFLLYVAPPTLAEVIAFLDRAVAAGGITGTGRHWLVQRIRLLIFRHVLVLADHLMARGHEVAACKWVEFDILRSDGLPDPADLITGPSRTDLNAQLRRICE